MIASYQLINKSYYSTTKDSLKIKETFKEAFRNSTKQDS
ncbi:unnamed protein product [Paramecium sonneborni]|uniref:Uncharacterized protein n=1 Tax=Paramecium sonneborni TaxID=65129 RepID=A0A8S1RQA3_9CILI|nr:unnamed protein product [Paramecium sonneborni]